MASNLLYSWCLVLALVVGGAAAGGYSAPAGFQPTPWQQAFATFYGDESASETMSE